ncbi:MAG TPA: HAD family hydrolase [Thermoplasmata archaeon]|nr:HAD family hydrolase [Thermoplasmata archaeon]
MPAPSEGAVRAVLFDLDDTIVPFQTPAHWQWAWRPQGPALPERHVRSATRKALRAWDRRRWQGLVAAAPPVGPADFRVFLHDTLLAVADRPLGDAEVESGVDRFLRPSPHGETFVDVPVLARWLAAHGVLAGVVTPMTESVAKSFAERSGLGAQLPLFADTGNADSPRLPTPSAFKAAREALVGRTGRVVYVGDLYWSDFRAAARAGLESILLDRMDLFPGLGGTRIRSLAELPALLEKEAPTAPPPDSNEPSDTASPG